MAAARLQIALRRVLGFFVREDRISPERSFRFLCRQIDFEFGELGRVCTISLTPARPDGSAVASALMLAALLDDEVGARVLLVDGTFSQKQSLSDVMGCGRAAGLAQLFKDPELNRDDFLKPTKRTNVSLLPRGVGTVALKGGQAAEAFGRLGEGFDYMIVCQEPITSDARNLEIVGQADLALLLVEEGATRNADIEDQENAMINHGVTDIRIVLILPEPLALHRSRIQ